MLPIFVRRAINDPFGSLSRDFDRALRGYLGESEVPAALAPYAVDVHEDADHYYVEAELPGFTKDQVDITLEDGVLSIAAERKEGAEKTPARGDPLHLERRWTRFERSFTLPTAVNENAVRADLNNGVLTITLDKREEVKPRKIQITDGPQTNGNKPGGASQG
jgi:HSP20 family protein